MAPIAAREPARLLVRILLTKLDDERHALEIERADLSRERVELETRSSLVHDLTHFAVEQAARLGGGFFGSLAAGRTLAEVGENPDGYAGERMQIERTVAVLQGLVRGGQGASAIHARITEQIAFQDETPPSWFTLELVQEVQERMRHLLGRWRATPYGRTMELAWTLEGE